MSATSPFGTEAFAVFEELLASEERSAALFGRAPDAVFVLDPQGRVAAGNDALERLTGYALAELLGRPLLALLLPEEHASAVQHFRAALAGEPRRYEACGVARDGRAFTVALSHLPLVVAGRTEGVYGAGRDVTAQRQAERDARAADERYRLLADNVQDMISLHDTNATFLYASPSAYRMLGVQPAELVGRSVWEMVLPEDLHIMQSAYRDILRREGRGPAAYRAHRADGRLGWFETTARVVMNEAGQPWRIIAVTRDITERREFEQHLVRAQKMEAVGRLAGGIAHDFNNMLTVIGGHAELLTTRLPAGAERDNAEHIRAAAHRAAALTGQLLRFSRTEARDVRITDPNAVVLDLQSMLGRLLGNDVRIEVELEPRLRTIRCEPASLEQVVLNLAVNARDAMPDGGVLRITTGNVRLGAEEHLGLAAGNYVLLTVRDNGTGMSTDVAQRVFEPFFTTKPEGLGTGLGLSTVYSMVTQCGGDVTLESVPGEGTTFRLYFPGDDAPATLTPDGRHAPAAALQGSGTILVAEDDPGVRSLMAAVLQRYGYTVLTAVNGADALALFHARNDEIDAVVSDVNMPEMQGPEFVRRVAETRASLPVLYISGFTSDSLHLDQVAGRCEFLAKPFTPVELAQAVRRLLTVAA